MTDSQGRTLQASFISLDSEKVTIKWNGQGRAPIPLASLSPDSQILAKKLASQMKGVSPPLTQSPQINYTHGRMQGRTLQARFVKLSFAGTLTIEWNGQMVPLPMTSLSPQSQALATQLASANKPKIMPPSSPKPVPAPSKPKIAAQPTVVTEDVALDEEHNWQAKTVL